MSTYIIHGNASEEIQNIFGTTQFSSLDSNLCMCNHTYGVLFNPIARNIKVNWRFKVSFHGDNYLLRKYYCAVYYCTEI